MAGMLAIALKDLRTFSRQRISLFFTFVWPLCVANTLPSLRPCRQPATTS